MFQRTVEVELGRIEWTINSAHTKVSVQVILFDEPALSARAPFRARSFTKLERKLANWCAWDREDYRKALVAAGFTIDP